MSLNESKVILLALVILVASFFANQLNYQINISGAIARDTAAVGVVESNIIVEESRLVESEEGAESKELIPNTPTNSQQLPIQPPPVEPTEQPPQPIEDFKEINIGGVLLKIKAIGVAKNKDSEIKTNQDLFLQALKEGSK